MCAIGRDLDTSIGANSPATTMLGAASIGGSSPRGAKRAGAAVGTLLTTGSVSSTPVGKPGDRPGSGKPTQMQR